MMRMQVERFLAITAVLATGSLMSVGCVSEDDADTNTDAQVNTGGTSSGGTGGSAGSATGGSAGTATGGSAGTATGGAAGGGGTAGSGGSAGACFGDTTTTDAGAEGIDCSTLPYFNDTCADGGVEGGPTGVAMCDYIAFQGRPGVQEAMHACLAAINVTDNCGQDHDNAVSDCVQDVYSNTCAPADPATAPSANCAELNTECPAVTEADCKINLDPLTQAAGDAVIDCYQAGTGQCDEDFLLCLGLP